MLAVKEPNQLVSGRNISSNPINGVERHEQHVQMSYADFLAVLDDSAHAEWVNGETLLFMPASLRHQNVAGFLYMLLRHFAEFFSLGKVFIAPFEMKVAPESNAREPDILYIATQHLHRLTDKKLEGPADLVIEIISTESVQRDRSDKFYEYQEAGIREYWLIDPRPSRQRADFWLLDADGRYQPIPIGQDGRYRSTVLPNFWLDVNWLWQNELPSPLLTLAKIVGTQALIDTLRQFDQS